MSRPRNKLQKVVNSQDIKEPATAGQNVVSRTARIASNSSGIQNMENSKPSTRGVCGPVQTLKPYGPIMASNKVRAANVASIQTMGRRPAKESEARVATVVVEVTVC